jgi:hypothetical protein
MKEMKLKKKVISLNTPDHDSKMCFHAVAGWLSNFSLKN